MYLCQVEVKDCSLFHASSTFSRSSIRIYYYVYAHSSALRLLKSTKGSFSSLADCRFESETMANCFSFGI